VPLSSPTPGGTKPVLRERLPSVALLILCFLPLGSLALEGIIRDWGAIFLRQYLEAQPFTSTLLFVTVSTSMALVRFSGDAILECPSGEADLTGSV
jgi:hypothetical protein